MTTVATMPTTVAAEAPAVKVAQTKVRPIAAIIVGISLRTNDSILPADSSFVYF